MKNKVIFIPLVAMLLVGCGIRKKEPDNPTPPTPVDPVDPSESNGVFERVFYSIKKYNPSLTQEALKEYGISPSKTTNYSYLFRLLYYGFKDVMPPLKGSRRYAGDFTKHNHTRLIDDEAAAYNFLAEHGLISENYHGSNAASTKDAELYLKRIYSYIGTDEKDDFAIANNYDFMIEHDSFDGYTADQPVMDNNLVSTDKIVTNAMNLAKSASGTSAYSNLDNLTNFYESKGSFDYSTSLTLANDYARYQNITNISQLINEMHNDFTTSYASGLVKYNADMLAAGSGGTVLFNFSSDQTSFVKKALSASSYSAFIKDNTKELKDYATKAKTMFSLSDEQQESLFTSYCSFIEKMREKYDNHDGYFYTSSNRFDNLIAYSPDYDPIHVANSAYSFDDIVPNNLVKNYGTLTYIDALNTEYIMDLATTAENYQAIRAYLIYDYVATYDGFLSSLHDLDRNYAFNLVTMMGYNLTSYYQGSSRFEKEYPILKGLFQDLIKALKDNAVTNGWLSATGINALKQKADLINHSLLCEYGEEQFAYSSVLNNNFTTDMAENVKIYLKNKSSVCDWFMYKQSRGEFNMKQCMVLNMEPFTPNAFYHPMTNSIYITMGYTFSKNALETVSKEELLATFGLVMGHEITHGFDSNGCYFNGYGQYVSSSIFPRVDLTAFENKQADVISLYNYEVMPGVLQSGSVTLSEDLADIGGLGLCESIARGVDNFNYTEFYRCLAKNFLSKVSRYSYYADGREQDVHAFGKARVNPLLMSSKKFQETFNLNENDGMYRNKDDAIVIW